MAAYLSNRSLRWPLVALGVFAVLIGACNRRRTVVVEKPNIILICLDTVRYDMFWMPESAGWNDPLKEWNEQALRFERVQSTAPWTVPAVASAITGQYPLRHGAGKFSSAVADLMRIPPASLHDNLATLPQILSQNGYDTHGIVANFWVNEATGLLRGLQKHQAVSTDKVTSAAMEWLKWRSSGEKPFYLYLHYMDAHGDRDPLRKLQMATSFSPSERATLLKGKPEGVCAVADSERCVEYLSYARAVLDLRAQLASLLDNLRKQRLLESTVVIAYSDHGEEFGEHMLEERRLNVDPRGPELHGVGHGASMYQELLHVPMLIWHPSHEGKAVSERVTLADITPTTLEWTGVKTHGQQFDGLSFANLNALSSARFTERPLYSSGIAYGPEMTAVLARDLKRVTMQCPEAAFEFDLGKDPAEKQPLTDRRATARLNALVAAYSALANTSRVTEARLTSEHVRSLQSLGYLQSIGKERRAVVADCSGRTAQTDSIGVWDPLGRKLYVRAGLSDGPADMTIDLEKTGVVTTGDWDANNTTTFGLFDAAKSQFQLYSSNLARRPAAKFRIEIPGRPDDDIPVSGDWNGDGTESVGIYRPSAATFYLKNDNTTGPPDVTIPFGIPGDRPLVGDWNGDGTATVGVYRPSIATFFLRKTNGKDEAISSITFGSPEDLPIAGDWDGDGVTSIGIFRPSLGMFFLRLTNETGEPDYRISFGTPSFLPVSGRWEL